MATAYTADTYADIQVAAPWGAAQTFIRPFSFNIANTTSGAGFIINDTLALCPLPYRNAGVGILVVDYRIHLPALDTGNTVRVALGDTNGASNAFQATYYSAVLAGGTSNGFLTGLLGYNDITTGKTLVFPNGSITTNGYFLPKAYTPALVYAAQASTYKNVDFMLKVTTAPGTATTTGTIKGWLMLQTLNQSVASFT